MDSEFTIPLTKDDLLCPAEDSYVVQEVYSVRGLPVKISDAFNVVNGGPYNILGQFDVFFSVAKHFAELGNQLKFDCWKCLNKALDKQMSDLINILEQDNIDRDTKKEHRNTLKMLSYLLTQFAEEFEAEDCKPSAVATPGRKKAKSKKPTSALPFDWLEVKKDFLNVTTQLLQINIVSLWEPPVAEEEFVNTFANCCYKFLENPGINREKNVRDSILNILAILVKKYNQSLSVGVKVIQLLQHFEHLIAPMAQLVQVCATEHGMRNIVVDILREIGRIDPKDLERDASGTRCYSDFLVELASRIPEHILPNISLLLCHLDTEPYSMRNGVLGVMGKLVILRLSQDDLTENMKNTRDQILDHLENHIHDVHAYVRSKVLQIWQNICREKAIPLARQQNLLSLVIGRLTDMSSNVRKNAIIYLKEYLMSNAFGSQFPLAEVKKKLEEEKEKLRKMDPGAVDENDEAPEACSSADLKRWLELECEIKRAVEDHWEVEDIVDEDGEHVEFQGDVNEALEYALMNVKRQMVSADYVKALAVLKAAVVTWPDYEMFKKSTDESEDNRNEEETTKNKEDIINREMALLKKVFLNPEFGPVSNPADVEDHAGNGSDQNTENGNTDPDSLVNEVSKQQIVIQYLKDYLSFHTQYQQALVVVCRLLGSQVASDVHESIEFVVIAYEFGLNNALLGVRRMLSLVWSKDNDIKTKVVDAYTRLYLNPQVQGQRAKAEAIVKNLFALLDGASIGDLTSLDELVYKLMKTNLLPKNVIHLLWEKFAMKDPQTTQKESKAALKLLGMLARGKHEIVKSNIDVLVNIGLGERARDDALLVRDTCTILLKLNQTDEKIRDDKQGPLRFPSEHVMFQRLNDILVNSITSPVQGMWVPMAEEAINVVYNLGEHPDRICCNLIKNVIKKVFVGEENLDNSDGNSEKVSEEPPAPMSCLSFVLARFLAAAGHIALQQVVHLETSILGEIKRRERLKEDRKGNKKKRTSTSTSVEQTPRTKEGPGETLEDEMGLTGATAEDAEAEYIKKICDHEIVTGGNNVMSLLGSFIVTVCNNPMKYSDLQLQTAASLALSKFMLVSAEFCEKNLQLLFTILEKSRHEVIRSNTIISLGDLTPRFPNLIEPWTPNLYARLRDDSSQVRMNTMKIMTRLILNDMVKVKGQISEMATCLEDDDSRIAELAKSFFAELAKKGNAVYNILPDIISRLSDPETGIPEAPFRNIMSYLFSFIQKDRQCESLVEKLCHRFRATRTDRQWIDLSFCLAQLSYNERSLRKLQENFACFQCTLSNDEVYSFFNTIIGKCKKMAKPEIKVVVEELELRIATCHEKGVDDDAGYERANQASAAARVLVGKAVNTPANKKTRSTKGRTPASRRRRKNDSESEVVPKPQTGKKSARKTRKKVIEFDSDDEEMFEGDWEESEKENVNV